MHASYLPWRLAGSRAVPTVTCDPLVDSDVAASDYRGSCNLQTRRLDWVRWCCVSVYCAGRESRSVSCALDTTLGTPWSGPCVGGSCRHGAREGGRQAGKEAGMEGGMEGGMEVGMEGGRDNSNRRRHAMAYKLYISDMESIGHPPFH